MATPFLDAVRGVSGELEAEAQTAPMSGPMHRESPFLSVYRQEGGGPVDPEAEATMELVGELYDEELDDVLFELLTEARLVHERFAMELPGAGGGAGVSSNRMLEAHFAPLLRELEAAFDHAALDLDGRDPATLTEAEVEAAFDGYATGGDLSPELEHLFGGFKKAFKKVGKKALKYAKKGVKAAATLGFGVLLRKLKPLLKPLLKAVIERGIKRLPTELQPFARKLAGRLPFLREIEEDPDAEEDEAPWSVSEVQYELDYQVARMLLAGDEAELDQEVARAVAETGETTPDAMAPLEEARERFVDRLLEADEEAELAPELERFIPAILPALKVGVKLYGRGRLVKQLARLLEAILKRFVPKRFRRSLSRAIVDAGLGLIHLEVTQEDEDRAAAEALAATVQDTVRRVAELPDHVLDDEAQLEGFALEAFEQAAADYLPQVLSEETYRERPDLRREQRFRATWIPVPLRRPRYRKLGKVPTVTISPQKAQRVVSFGGETLAEFFQDRLGLAPGEDVEARVHLYEVGDGTLLPEVAHHERSVPGLGSSDRVAFLQLHPLTEAAAGMLLDEPALGRKLPARALADRRKIGGGQRVYFLEIANARPQLVVRPTGGRDLRRPTDLRVVVDCPAGEVRVHLFLSEATAQRMAVRMRRDGSAAAVLPALGRIVGRGVRGALTGGRCGALRVVHGAVGPGQGGRAVGRRVPQAVSDRLAKSVTERMGRALARRMEKEPQDFMNAIEAPDDGVTIIAALADPAGLRRLDQALRGVAAGLHRRAVAEEAMPVRLEITPGGDRG